MELKVGKYNVAISNPDKILFPKAKITKLDLIEYYQEIAPIMLSHIKNRPLTMNRFPNGISEPMFYQKDAPDFFPNYIALQPVERSSGATIEYAMANNQAAIVYLANYVCVPHVWLSRAPKLNYPDRMIFDFDPSPGVTFTTVKWAAQKMRKLLEDDLGLPAFLMTTGSRGLHVVVPIKKVYLFDQVRELSQNIAQILVDQHPDKLTLEIRKAKRGTRIFVDTLRNAWGATAVAPYGVRAKPGAPVATPLLWRELSALTTPQKYTIKNIFARISRMGDVWQEISKKACGLAKVERIVKERVGV